MFTVESLSKSCEMWNKSDQGRVHAENGILKKVTKDQCLTSDEYKTNHHSKDIWHEQVMVLDHILGDGCFTLKDLDKLCDGKATARFMVNRIMKVKNNEPTH